MPFEFREGERGPHDFVVVSATGYTPTQTERECLDRLNNFVGSVFAQVPEAQPDTSQPRAAELSRERDDCIEQLRMRAQDWIAGRMTAADLFLTTYKYEGRYDERVVRVKASKFIVDAGVDPRHRQFFIDVRYQIGPGPVSKEQLDSKRALDQAETVVKVVLAGRRTATRAKRHKYIRALVNIGRSGLSDGNVELATSTLDTLRNEFVASEAARIKNHYVRRLGIWSAILILLFLWIYLSILSQNTFKEDLDWQNFWTLLNTTTNPTDTGLLYRFRNFFVLAIGASFSAWLAFLIRRPTLGFSDLMQLDDDLLNPATRVLFTIGLAFVVGLLFWTGMVAINVGKFSTDFQEIGTTAMLIGVFCGIASRALATAVSQRAEDFAGNVGRASPPAAPPAG
jgi:hypothetical protein